MSTLPKELQTCSIFTSLGSFDVDTAYPAPGGELSTPRAFRGAHGSAGRSHTVKFKYAYLTKAAPTEMLLFLRIIVGFNSNIIFVNFPFF